VPDERHGSGEHCNGHGRKPSRRGWRRLALHPVSSQASLIGKLAQLGGRLILRSSGLIFLMGYLMRRVGPLANQGGVSIFDWSAACRLAAAHRIYWLMWVQADVCSVRLQGASIPCMCSTSGRPKVTASGAITSDFARTLRWLAETEPRA